MNTKANQRPREKVWGPFFHLLRITKLPWVWILFVAVFTLTRTQLNLLFPSYTQKITAGDVSAATILTMVIVVLGQAVLTGLSGAVSGVATGKISLRFRESVWGRLLKLPVSYFDTHMPRELINRVTQDTTMLSDYISSFPGGILSGIYSLVGTFVILFSYDWHLVMVEAIMIPLVVLCAILEGHLNFLTNKKIQGRMAELTAFLAEIVTHIPLVKTFVKENYEEGRGEQCIDDLYRTKFKWSIIGSIANMLLNILIIVNTIVCVAFGAWLCSRGDITVDIWIAFYMYSQSLLISVAGMLNYWSGLKRIQGAALRISQVTAEPVEPETGSGDVSLKNCGLEVKDLSFCYDEKTVLSHVSFTIPHGKNHSHCGAQRQREIHIALSAGALLSAHGRRDFGWWQGYWKLWAPSVAQGHRLCVSGYIAVFRNDPRQYPLWPGRQYF